MKFSTLSIPVYLFTLLLIVLYTNSTVQSSISIHQSNVYRPKKIQPDISTINNLVEISNSSKTYELPAQKITISQNDIQSVDENSNEDGETKDESNISEGTTSQHGPTDLPTSVIVVFCLFILAFICGILTGVGWKWHIQYEKRKLEKHLAKPDSADDIDIEMIRLPVSSDNGSSDIVGDDVNLM